MVTTVKKGSKIAKLPATPKRSGYTFIGWYTKKEGGKKITKNTKPTKSLSYHAQWNNARVLNSEEKRLVGEWKRRWDGTGTYKFYTNGSFIAVSPMGSYSNGKFYHSYDYLRGGNYSVKNGILTLRYRGGDDYGTGFVVWGNWTTSTMPLKFSTEDGNQYVYIGNVIQYKKV